MTDRRLRSGSTRRRLRRCRHPRRPALGEMLKAPGVRLSGLRTEGGALILKAEKGDASVQLRVANGEAFDVEGGLDVRLPVTLDLRRCSCGAVRPSAVRRCVP